MNTKRNKLIFDKAVQLLAQRDHSAYELSQKLKLFFLNKIQRSDDNDHQFDQLQIDIDDVIQHCIEKNWINDTQFIENYINRRANKGYGQYKIAMELKQRGLSVNLSQNLLQILNIDWVNIASEQLIKKFKKIDVKDIQQKQKGCQFLLNRGFTQSQIKEAYLSLIENARTV